MSGVERDELLSAHPVAYVEIVGTDGVALQSYAEDLRLDAVLHVGIFLREYAVERILEQFAVHHAVDGYVLAAVVYPEVHYARVVLPSSHLLRYGAAA